MSFLNRLIRSADSRQQSRGPERQLSSPLAGTSHDGQAESTSTHQLAPELEPLPIDSQSERATQPATLGGSAYAPSAAVVAKPAVTTDPAAHIESGNEDIDARDVVHEALKGLEKGSSLDIFSLEKAAMEFAQVLADKGLPRHDIPATELIDEELVLQGRAKETYWKWVKAVRRRMNAAIAKELAAADASLATANTALAHAEASRRGLEELVPRDRAVIAGQNGATTEELASAADEALEPEGVDSEHEASDVLIMGEPVRISYTERWANRNLGTLALWSLLVLLVVADFVANAQVFMELFPASASLSRTELNWAESYSGQWFLGLGLLGLKLMLHPESTLLAFSVVIFFLWLGHTTGEALRRHRASAHRVGTLGEREAQNIRVQAMWPLRLGVAGLVLVVAMLYWSRLEITPMARERHARAEAEFHRADSVYAAANVAGGDLEAMRRARADRRRMQDNLDLRRERLNYAESIKTLNLPIGLLNVVLALTAIIAGYRREKVEVELERLEAGLPRLIPAAEAYQDNPSSDDINGSDDRDVPEVQLLHPPAERLDLLRNRYRDSRMRATEALDSARRSIARSDQLLEVDPFREWQHMTERLNCAVPAFRSENARLRHLDTRDIQAFKIDATMEFEQPQFTPADGIKAKLALIKEQYTALRSRYSSMETGGVRLIDRRDDSLGGIAAIQSVDGGRSDAA